jgi:hypothetical protein
MIVMVTESCVNGFMTDVALGEIILTNLDMKRAKIFYINICLLFSFFFHIIKKIILKKFLIFILIKSTQCYTIFNKNNNNK